MNITRELEKEYEQRTQDICLIFNKFCKKYSVIFLIITVDNFQRMENVCSVLKPEYIDNFNNTGLLNFPKMHERSQSSYYTIKSMVSHNAKQV